MTDYKPGDRVRVVLEGFVTAGPGAFNEYRVSEDAEPGAARVSWAWVRPAHMERLPDPEPDWQPGDVVRAADGGAYSRESHACRGMGWMALGLDYAADAWRSHDAIPRPLTPLVRGGKPWGES